jgi:hypothetical protein
MTNTTSMHARSAVLAFAIALSTAACATDDVETSTADTIWVNASEIVEVGGIRSTELTGLGMSDGAVIVEDSVCACDTNDCVEEYVRDRIGCDVCVHFTCLSGDRLGGCVRCDP